MAVCSHRSPAIRRMHETIIAFLLPIRSMAMPVINRPTMLTPPIAARTVAALVAETPISWAWGTMCTVIVMRQKRMLRLTEQIIQNCLVRIVSLREKPPPERSGLSPGSSLSWSRTGAIRLGSALSS